jgi:hypothetical protein
MDELSRRKFLKQFAVLSAGVSAVLLTGCSEDQPLYGVPVYGVPFVSDNDVLGNLYIHNIELNAIVLFEKQKRIKTMKNWRDHAGVSQSPIRVNVPRNQNDLIFLEVYSLDDIGESSDSPIPSKTLKRWQVNLPLEISERPTYIWIIDMSAIKDCGELVLNYSPGSDVKVDVNIHFSERRLITERVMPGIQLHLGLAYGECTIEYIYWKEKAPKAGDWIELGRITTETVDGVEVPILSSINTENQHIERTIPNWGG